MNNKKIINLTAPTSAKDAATKRYLHVADAALLAKSDGTMSEYQYGSDRKITGLNDPYPTRKIPPIKIIIKITTAHKKYADDSHISSASHPQKN